MKDLKIFTKNIEQKAIDDINAFMELEAFKNSKVRIMPDVHAGKGCVIGFTATVDDKIIPNVVGVDIGCGMYCMELGKVELDLKKVDEVIRKFVPHGQNVFSYEKDMTDDAMFWSKKFIDEMYCVSHLTNRERLYRSMGTLGGGNHFIEINEDGEGNKYLVIHSGSRNLGKQVCEYYQNVAIKDCSVNEKYDELTKEMIRICKDSGNVDIIASVVKAINVAKNAEKIPDDLCYLEGIHMAGYLHDMNLCQAWAKNNREMIANVIWEKAIWDGNFPRTYPHGFHTMHNYVNIHDWDEFDVEDTIVRKGAISAKKGEKVLIPMNMRDGSLICIGNGNEDWNCSAPHGAGRIMSRVKAKETLNLDDYKSSMDGIFTTSISKETLDEAPMVYKPMEEIIANISDTVEIVDVIKPIYNFKSSN